MHLPPDTHACIFWLRNRRPEEWREKREPEPQARDDRDEGWDERLAAASERAADSREIPAKRGPNQRNSAKVGSQSATQSWSLLPVSFDSFLVAQVQAASNHPFTRSGMVAQQIVGKQVFREEAAAYRFLAVGWLSVSVWWLLSGCSMSLSCRLDVAPAHQSVPVETCFDNSGKIGNVL